MDTHLTAPLTAPIFVTKRRRSGDDGTIETVVETTDVPSSRIEYTEADMKRLVEGLLQLRFWTGDYGNHPQTPAAQRERHALDALLVKMGCDQDQLDLLDRFPA